MSVGSAVTVLGPRYRTAARGASADSDRPIVRLATFAALGLYGTLRWSTLMHPAAVWRLIGLLAVAVTLASLGMAVEGTPRWLVVLASVLCAIAIFPIAGIPLEWVRHVRLSVGANALDQGLTALPNVLVPYLGINHWVRVVILLGAGVLLLDAGLLLAFAPRSLGDVRRAGAALPLLALAVVPMTLVKPQLPYLQGLILFALLAAFIWGERAPTRNSMTAVLVVSVAGIGAVIGAPRIDPHSSWIDYEALANTLTLKHIDTFDWSQTYGPLQWPSRGTDVFDVQAARADYWKTENLDVFSGSGWTTGNFGPGAPQDAISSAARARWTQTIQVTIRAMRTSDVIAAGDASTPTDVPQGAYPGISPGTWVADAPLRPGDSYRVSSYSPHPSPAELEAAGTDYPVQLRSAYLSMAIPGFYARKVGYMAREVAVFPTFGTPLPTAFGPRSAAAGTFIWDSPYARAYALAERLRRGAETPYAYAERIMAYLARGYTYDLHVPARPYPIEAFLFSTKRGYCQQFAGAMALLLRMGGVPARVAVGFTPGSYDSATHEWVVDDADAHAWVEAWFPGYGWYRFDPTPPSAASPSTLLSAAQDSGSSGPESSVGHGPRPVARARNVRGDGGESLPIGLGIAALVGLLAIGLVGARRARLQGARTGDELLIELDRALRRCGRPVTGGLTLAALEHRYRASEGAAGYVRCIRVARYGAAGVPPTRAQRRALRAELAAGLGFAGRLRALWALPPRH